MSQDLIHLPKGQTSGGDNGQIRATVVKIVTRFKVFKEFNHIFQMIISVDCIYGFDRLQSRITSFFH